MRKHFELNGFGAYDKLARLMSIAEVLSVNPQDQEFYDRGMQIIAAKEVDFEENLSAINAVQLIQNTPESSWEAILSRVANADNALGDLREFAATVTMPHFAAAWGIETTEYTQGALITHALEEDIINRGHAVLSLHDQGFLKLADQIYEMLGTKAYNKREYLLAMSHVGLEIATKLFYQFPHEIKGMWVSWMMYYIALESAFAGASTNAKILAQAPEKFNPEFVGHIQIAISVDQHSFDEAQVRALLFGHSVSPVFAGPTPGAQFFTIETSNKDGTTPTEEL